MKSMLSDVNFAPRGGTMVPPIYAHHRRPDDEYVDFEDYHQLRMVLDKALEVIDAWQTMAEAENITNGGIRHCLEKRAELETALRPFKTASVPKRSYMMERFEQKIVEAADGFANMITLDAIEIAREADAALAARQRENISIKEVMVEQACKIEILTDINNAKSELIDFYANYINSLSGYLSTHQMDPSDEQVEYGNRLRARIRSLENE